MKELIAKWEKTPSEDDTFIRIDAEHPVDIYVGKNGKGEYQFMVMTDDKPLPFPDSNYFTVRKGIRKDGRYTTVFRLFEIEHKQEYFEFCFGLIGILKDYWERTHNGN
jgi:hypothetical protein